MATSKKILAERLAELKGKTPALDTQEKIAARAKLSQSSVGRMLKGDVAATLDSLDAVAAVFGVQAWQLISPGEANREALALAQSILQNRDAILGALQWENVKQDTSPPRLKAETAGAEPNPFDVPLNEKAKVGPEYGREQTKASKTRKPKGDKPRIK